MNHLDPYRVEPATVEPLLVDAVSAAKLLSISQKTLWLYTQSGDIRIGASAAAYCIQFRYCGGSSRAAAPG